MKFRVTLEGVLTSTSGSIDDAARKALTVAMSELNVLGAGNAAIDLDARTGEITVSCAVEAEGPISALQPASDNIRLSLHHAEIGTPEWPEVDDPHWNVEFIRSRTEALAAA